MWAFYGKYVSIIRFWGGNKLCCFFSFIIILLFMRNIKDYWVVVGGMLTFLKENNKTIIEMTWKLGMKN